MVKSVPSTLCNTFIFNVDNVSFDNLIFVFLRAKQLILGALEVAVGAEHCCDCLLSIPEELTISYYYFSLFFCFDQKWLACTHSHGASSLGSACDVSMNRFDDNVESETFV